MQVISGRQTTDNQSDLVVFLIGARVNKWWLLPLALPILATMRTMQLELLKDPTSGLLGIQSFGMGGQAQYWRSLDALLRYTDSREKQHHRTSKRFYQKLFKNESVGIWHETYVVKGGQYEAFYGNMPRFGLGRAQPLVEAKGPLTTARGRLGMLPG